MNKRLSDAMEELYGPVSDPLLLYNFNLEAIANNGLRFIGSEDHRKHEWFLKYVRAMTDQAMQSGKEYIDSLCMEAERYISITEMLMSSGVLDNEQYNDVIVMLRKISKTENKLKEDDISMAFDEEEDIKYCGFIGEVDMFLNYSRTVAETPAEGFAYHDMWAKQFGKIMNEARKSGDKYLEILRSKKEELLGMIPRIAKRDPRGTINYISLKKSLSDI